MNERRKYLILLILGSVGFSSLLLTNAYAQSSFELSGFHQGVGVENGLDSSSKLSWKVDGQLQDTSGTTDDLKSFLTATSRLSFTDESGSLGTIIGITVDGESDLSGIGFNFCHSPINWNFQETLTVNGIEYNIGKTLSNTMTNFDSSGNFINKGLRFEPELVERLLSQQGVNLKSGDVLIWKVTGSNTFTIAEGIVINTSLRIASDPSSFVRSDFGTCVVSTDSKFINNVQSENPEVITIVTDSGFQQTSTNTGVLQFTEGQSVEFRIKYLDPTEQLVSASGLNINEPDFDNDGIPDNVDRCSFSPETYNNFEDDDGCPDDVPPPTISVIVNNVEVEQPVEVASDEIVVINEETGEAEVIQNLDVDNDGVPNDIDECPVQQGIPALDGCPDQAIVDSREFLQREFDRIEANNPVTNVHFNEVEDIKTEQGISGTCDQSIQNCDDVITQAIQNLQGTIRLPFEPSILNLMIIFGAIAGIVVVIAKVTKKI